MPAWSAATIIVSSASREFAMRTEAWFFRKGSRPCGSLGLSVCGTSGSRITLMPCWAISVIVCWMVRPVPWPPLAQKVVPMYCSMGAPLGLVGSLAGSWRPSSPNQDPQRTGKSWLFLVIRPCAFTRKTALPTTVLKVAVTVRACVMATVQPAVPVQAPLQPANVEPVAAEAVSVTLVPFAKLAFCVVQAGPQLIPAGLDVTVRVPVPALVTVSVWLTGLALKVAVTVRACVMATVHVPVPVQAPLQPANVDPVAAEAVTVTFVPFGKLAFCVVQPGPQLIPVGLDVTVPVPVPGLVELRVGLLGAVL